MVERISTPGLSSVIGVNSSNPRSVSVHVGSRKPKESDGRNPPRNNPYTQNSQDEAVLVGRYRQASGAYARDRRDEDVSIDQSTSMLLADDLGALIQRASENVRLVFDGILGAADDVARSLAERFTQECLDEVRLAILLYVRQQGQTGGMPLALEFSNVMASVDHDEGTYRVEIGAARFSDRVDLNAKGVVFDVRGTGAVHEPVPGLLVDIGEHGAGLANTLIEAVRGGVSDLDAGLKTEGVISIIRADRSIYAGGRKSPETICLDIIIPFATSE